MWKQIHTSNYEINMLEKGFKEEEIQRNGKITTNRKFLWDISLFQNQGNITLVDSMLIKHHMKVCSWSSFLTKKYGVWCNI